SAAEQFTGVVPYGNVDPDAGLHPAVARKSPSTASCAVTENVTVAPSGRPLWTTMSSCAIVGAVVSTTLTTNDPVVVWALLPVAEQLTGVSPSGNSAGEKTGRPATVQTIGICLKTGSS